MQHVARKPIFCIIIVMICLWALFPARAKATQVNIRVAVECNLPPFQFMDEKGEIVGLHVDIMNAIAKSNNMVVEYIPYETSSDAVKALLAGEVDVVLGILSGSTNNTDLIITNDISSASISLIVNNKYLERVLNPQSGCQLYTTAFELGTITLEVLEAVKKIDSNIEVIIMTAYGSIGTSVEAMKNGAFTYLTKPIDIEELKVVMKQAGGVRKLNEQVIYLSDELRNHRHYDEIVGESESMQRIYSLIDKVKDIDTNVLITGESGTGKELVAKAIQDTGKRSKERFIIVNCAAIPESLLELEFFGYKKGAFTGALQDRKGKFELADNGTLFLDEIGDMPIGLQGKLLRVLQDKEFMPLGSNQSIKVDVRILAATNRNLKKMIEEQKFRQDLYYRLKVIEIKVPPLRERRDDIPAICSYLLNQFSKELNKPLTKLTPAAVDMLVKLNYPGNVRQLANILEYAAIVCTQDVIDLKDFPEDIRKESAPAAHTESIDDYLSITSLREIERRTIEVTLRKNHGRRDQSADQLGISKRGLLNKIKEYGLNDKEQENSEKIEEE